MVIISEYGKDEKIKFEELLIELNYLTKRWDIYFEENMGNWKINCYPKKSKPKKQEEE